MLSGQLIRLPNECTSVQVCISHIKDSRPLYHEGMGDCTECEASRSVVGWGRREAGPQRGAAFTALDTDQLEASKRG